MITKACESTHVSSELKLRILTNHMKCPWDSWESAWAADPNSMTTGFDGWLSRQNGVMAKPLSKQCRCPMPACLRLPITPFEHCVQGLLGICRERVSGFKEAWMTLNLAYNMCWDRQVETNLRRWHSLEKRRPAVRSSKSSNSGNQIFYFPSQSNLRMYECLYKICVWFLKNGLPRWSSLKSTHKY